MKISKNSWHYKWISRLEFGYNHMNLKYEPILDSCTYTRKLIGAFVKTQLLVTVAAAFIASIGNFIAWVTVLLFTGWVLPDIPAVIILSFIAFFLCILFWAGVEELIKYLSYRSQNREKSEPGTFLVLVKMYKDKMCAKIEVVE